MSDETTNTQNLGTVSFICNPASTATATTSYIPYTTYPSFTSGYSYVYAQLTEQQLADLESRMSLVVRKEIAHTLSLLLSALSDDEEDEEVE